MAKRQIEIEKLLQWTYRDELPKRQTSSAEGIWKRLEQYGSLGGVDTDQHRWAGGGAQRYAQFGLPHDDAFEIEKAVSALPNAVIDWAVDGAVIMGRLIALADPRPPSARQKRKTTIGYNDRHADKIGWRTETVRPREFIAVRTLRTAALVAGHAHMGSRPQLDLPRPYPIEAERGPRNRPKLVGECRGKNLYSTGSCMPLQWLPSPLEVAQDRADYVAWWRGLARLAASLRLAAHDVLPPAVPQYPWNEPSVEHQIFTERPLLPMKPLPLKPQRERAGHPPPRSRHGSVTMISPDA